LSLSFVACGGSEFSAGKSTGGGGSGGGSAGDTVVGSSGQGGTSSGGASAGGAGGSPSGGANAAGTGGNSATTCDCAANSYCQDGANKCRLCSDFSRFEFASPEKLATVSQTPSGNERFPRAASAGLDLFYRSGAPGAERIWYAAAPVSGIGVQLSPPTFAESGPLFSPFPASTSPPGVLAQNFFFDRVSGNVRHLMMSTWSGGTLSSAAPAPSPLNGTASDYSIALARDVSRAYWMSTRAGNTTADLVWSAMLDGAVTTPAVLDLQIQVGTSKCHRTGDDATPWVNAAGTLLLFRNESLDTITCGSNGGFDLYAVPLSSTGQPTAAGVALSALNTSGPSAETDPSLSQDSCWIYFASDGGTTDFDLYRAARN
jgi:hypothetical protein